MIPWHPSIDPKADLRVLVGTDDLVSGFNPVPETQPHVRSPSPRLHSSMSTTTSTLGFLVAALFDLLQPRHEPMDPLLLQLQGEFVAAKRKEKPPAGRLAGRFLRDPDRLLILRTEYRRRIALLS